MLIAVLTAVSTSNTPCRIFNITEDNVHVFTVRCDEPMSTGALGAVFRKLSTALAFASAEVTLTLEGVY